MTGFAPNGPVKEYYQGSIPHVLILDANGEPLYDSPGEVDSKHISSTFEQSFSQASGGSKSGSNSGWADSGRLLLDIGSICRKWTKARWA